MTDTAQQPEGGPDLHAALRRYWGYDEFRPRQEAIVRSLMAGRDVAVVMPTGGGKSLCYQLPVALNGGTAVVVSPLVALMQDQAAAMNQIGVPAAVINSSQSRAEQGQVMQAASEGAYRLVYLSPERMARGDTNEWLARLDVAYFVVDEAHCISEWGHEFRPEYRELSRLRANFPGKPIAALTASATIEVRRDILRLLNIGGADKYIVSFHRPNLRYLVRKCNDASQERLLFRALKANQPGSAIVYSPTIARVGQTVDLLKASGIQAVGYHAKMPGSERSLAQKRWMNDDVRVLVGTVAFGLGINKPGVRSVIHLSLPKSLEQYYQEAGRAGRDGEEADCLLLWRGEDIGLLAYFIGQVDDPRERSRQWQHYRNIRAFVEGDTCRHLDICRHFGESPSWDSCGMCDACGPQPGWWVDTAPALAPRAGAGRRRERADTTAAGHPGRDEALFNHLKEWRREVARAAEVPSFVVLHDSSLDAICMRLPRTMEEILQVKGIGAHKAALYGEEILATLRAYRSGQA